MVVAAPCAPSSSAHPAVAATCDARTRGAIPFFTRASCDNGGSAGNDDARVTSKNGTDMTTDRAPEASHRCGCSANAEPKSMESTERDVVCGMTVKPATAKWRTEHEGHAFVF